MGGRHPACTDRRPALDAGDMSEPTLVTWSLPAAAVLGQRHPRRGAGRLSRVKAKCGAGRDVAGHVGLAHLDGVGTLHQLARGRGAGAPVAAAVDRVFDRGPALQARQRQRRVVGDLVGARGARVVGQRHGGRCHAGVEGEGEGGVVGVAGDIGRPAR